MHYPQSTQEASSPPPPPRILSMRKLGHKSEVTHLICGIWILRPFSPTRSHRQKGWHPGGDQKVRSQSCKKGTPPPSDPHCMLPRTTLQYWVHTPSFGPGYQGSKNLQLLQSLWQSLGSHALALRPTDLSSRSGSNNHYLRDLVMRLHLCCSLYLEFSSLALHISINTSFKCHLLRKVFPAYPRLFSKPEHSKHFP